jgi:hypothetical protein
MIYKRWRRNKVPRRIGLAAAMFSILSKLRGLFLSMFLSVSLPRILRMLSGMDGVSGCRVSMMGRFFMLPSVMMLGRFTVMVGGMRVMFRCLSMVISCFLRHAISSLCWAVIPFITVSNVRAIIRYWHES